MWSIAVLVAAAVMAWVEVPDLRRKKAYRELAVFALLLAAGTGFGVAHSFRVPLPNPIELIFYVFRPASDMLKGILT